MSTADHHAVILRFPQNQPIASRVNTFKRRRTRAVSGTAGSLPRMDSHQLSRADDTPGPDGGRVGGEEAADPSISIAHKGDAKATNIVYLSRRIPG
jgi:hypothetical protein